MTTAQSETTLSELHKKWQSLTGVYERTQRQCDEIWSTSPDWYQSPALSRNDAHRICASIEHETRSKVGAHRSLALCAKIKTLLDEEIISHARNCSGWEQTSQFASTTQRSEKIYQSLSEIREQIIKTPVNSYQDIAIKLGVLHFEMSSHTCPDDISADIEQLILQLTYQET